MAIDFEGTVALEDRIQSMREEDVIAYLRANRDFFTRHPHTLDIMQTPKQSLGKGVVDFQSFLVDRLKNEKQQITQTKRALIENARTNMDNLQRIHSAILALLEAESFGEFVDIVVQDLPMLLDVDVATLVVENYQGILGRLPSSGILLAQKGTVKRLFGEGDAYLQSDTAGDASVFGIAAPLVRSVALVRLKIEGERHEGILAFGATDPEGFHEDQAIDQIAFLGQIVERCLRAWMNSRNRRQPERVRDDSAAFNEGSDDDEDFA